MVEQVIERWIISPIADETLARMADAQPLKAVHLGARDGRFELDFEPYLAGTSV